MKLGLKIVGSVLLVVLLGVGSFAGYIHFGWPMKKPMQTIDIKVEATPERLARGKKLVSVRCAQCHYDQKTNALTGTHLAAEPAEFGTMYSRNITNHPTKGAGRYTDGELVYLLRTGIKRDGYYSGPYMSSRFLADEDIYSIIAFLRSDDPWVRSMDVDDRESQPTFLLKFLFTMLVPSPPFPTQPIVAPDPSDRVALGKYLVTSVGDCFVCHSKSFPTLNSEDPEKSADYMAGGNELLDGRRHVVRGANLTLDPDTGIGKWTEAEFIKTVRSAFRPDSRPLRYPMVAYSELTDDEVGAIYAYIKSLPALRNEISRDFDDQASASASASDGERLYRRYQCTSCHGDEGVGVCDLRQARSHYATDEELMTFIRDPSKLVPGTKMPTWDGVIAEADYAPLIKYIRELEMRGAAAPAH